MASRRSIPQAGSNSPSPARRGSNPHIWTRSNHVTPTGRYKIVCIEDEPISLTVAAKLLTSSGFDVVTASSGVQGLELVRKSKPDLVLLDAVMPGMDGYEVCAKLQKDPQTAYIPVIFTTSLSEEQDKVRAFGVGAVDYFTKPLRKELIIPKIHHYLRKKEKWLDLISQSAPYDTDYFRFKKYLFQRLSLRVNERESCEVIPPQDIYSMAVMLSLESHELARIIADFTGIPYLDDISNRSVLLGVLPAPFCLANRVIPIDERGGVAFILSNPFQWDILDTLRKVGKRPQSSNAFYLTEPERIDALLANRQLPVAPAISLSPPSAATTQEDADARKLDALIESDETLVPNEATPAGDTDSELLDPDSSIVKLTNLIIRQAYQRGVSDIHIEPSSEQDPCQVRFRVDGECYKHLEVPAAYAAQLVSRLKIMAKLDITEKRKPQDGKLIFTGMGQKVELRVATIPTVGNVEDVVMRILASNEPIPLDKMRFSDRNLRALKDLIQRPYGIILCVGPTGSGKTTTLHSCLGHINTPQRKIWTAEDPVEITQRGLRQVQVQPKIGFTFATALRSFLRADPDVIMVGEMRDEETAAMGVEASLTGHLVLSTLHTNSAPETITRLLDMGLQPFNFGDALLGILAQRLARTLCSNCKQSYVPSSAELQEMRQLHGPAAFDRLLATLSKDFVLYRPVGCDKCSSTGYKGRIGLHELLVNSDEIKEMIIRKERIDRLRDLAMAQGMTTLLQDGVQKVLMGHLDMKSVRAVASK